MTVSQAESVFDIEFTGVQYNFQRTRKWLCFNDNETKSSFLVETLLELPGKLKEVRERFEA